MEVLLTGFDPFDGQHTNPSWEAAATVRPSGYDLTTLQLPCVFDKSLEILRAALAAHRYDVVISVGQAGGRAHITPERVAINLNDARIPDNAGNQPTDTPVIPNAPTAYFSTLPVKACTTALTTAGIPAAVSHTAGTFVCNHVFYGLMHLAATEHPHLRAGFVHVPYTPDQTTDDTPSLPLHTTTRALELIIRTTLDTPADLPLPGGTLH